MYAHTNIILLALSGLLLHSFQMGLELIAIFEIGKVTPRRSCNGVMATIRACSQALWSISGHAVGLRDTQTSGSLSVSQLWADHCVGSWDLWLPLSVCVLPTPGCNPSSTGNLTAIQRMQEGCDTFIRSGKQLFFHLCRY